MNSTIITKNQGCVLQVVLNRPEKCNSFNPQLIDALTRVFGELASGAAPELRLVHISGSGSVFCAGADLQWMQASRNLSEEANYHDADRLFLMYQAMQKCPVPIVTQVHGAVFGGGIGLCSVSDIVIADTQSYFSLSETRRGLIPAVMMPFVIEKLGKSRTRELTITGRTFTAEEAVAYGLVHFISTPKTRKSVTESVIQNTIASAPEAIRESRDLIGRSSDRSFESLRHDLVHTLSQKRSGAEAQEGLSAFFEKREPRLGDSPMVVGLPASGRAGKVLISTATVNDLADIVRLENEVWSPEQACSIENFLFRLHFFREGFLLGRIDGELVASFYAIRRRHEPGEHINWDRDSGWGTGNTHDPDGNSLFSLSCTVSRKAPKGTYRKMMEAWMDLARRIGVDNIYAGSRAVGLSEFAGTLHEYVPAVRAGEVFDPILSKAMHCGFSLGNLIPDYFEDPLSLNYGVEIFQLTQGAQPR